MGFWLVNTIAICTMLVNGAVSSLGDCGLPCGRRDSLCTLQLFCSALLRTSSIAATLGMSGWLLLTQQGLSPCQKRQALLDALTPALSRGGERSERPSAGARCCAAPLTSDYFVVIPIVASQVSASAGQRVMGWAVGRNPKACPPFA